MTKIEKSILYILRGLLFLTPFIVLYVPSWVFFPYIFGKAISFRIITELVFAGWVYLLLTGAIPKPHISKLFLSIGVFVSIIALADIFGANIFKSFWSNFERMEGLVTLIHAFAYFIVLGSLLSNKKLWEWFWRVSLSVSLVVGLIGLMEALRGVERIASTLGNPIYLAIYALFHIFIALFYVFGEGRWFWKFTYAGMAVFNVLILWLTGTRGALLGLLAGFIISVIVYSVLYKGNLKRIIRFATYAVLATIFVLSTLVFVNKDSDFIKNNYLLSRIAHISISTDATSRDTSTLRLIVWETALKGVADKPILGWGQGNFNYIFEKYYNPNMYWAEQWYDRTHNIILDWLVAGGILGLFGYISIYIFAVKDLVSIKHITIAQKAVLSGLLAGYFVHNLFVFDNIISYLLFFGVLAFMYTLYISEDTITESVNYINVSVQKTMIAGVITIICVLATYSINYPVISQNTNLIKALRLSSSKQLSQLEQSLNIFLQISEVNTAGTQEVREQFLSVARAIAQTPNLPIKFKQQFLSDALLATSDSMDHDPQNPRYPYLIGITLAKYGQFKSAIDYLKKASDLSPRRVLFLISLANVSEASGDKVSALMYYRKILALVPTYQLVQNKVKTLSKNNNIKK